METLAATILRHCCLELQSIQDPRPLVSPKLPRVPQEGGRVQGWESACWGVLEIPLLENRTVCRIYQISISWFLIDMYPWFLRFYLTNVHHFPVPISTHFDKHEIREIQMYIYSRKTIPRFTTIIFFKNALMRFLFFSGVLVSWCLQRWIMLVLGLGDGFENQEIMEFGVLGL